MADGLGEYRAKRDFARTAEPDGTASKARAGRSFVVQKHAATRLHYDFRLEWKGVLLSWAVTRGPSADMSQKRLAVRTEDHPLDYGGFEGTIPKGEYGGGTVMLWDRGTWDPLTDFATALEEGKLKFTLHGVRMKGNWTLIRMKPEGKRENWLLIKERDDFMTDDPDGLTEAGAASIATGRTMEEIAAGKLVPAERASSKTDRRKPAPGFREVQLATLVADAPEGDEWCHETKFDGYRCLAAVGKGGARLFTRAGNDWTTEFGALGGAFDDLPCKSALIDGEVMAGKITGSAFSSLKAALSSGDPLVFYAFDLLEIDGRDLTGEPLLDRRARLAKLIGNTADGMLRMSEHIEGHGPEVFRRACEAGAEGIISKRADAPYRAGRNADWLKIKCTRRQEFVIGGYSPSDKKGRPFASLLVGTFEGGVLHYRGRVGTGFDEAGLAQIEKAMTARKTSPFDDVPGVIARSARWLRPDMVAEVAFAEFTDEGHIRHGSFQGLREDKPAERVRIETPQAPDGKIGGIAITHPDRVIYPGAGVTKREVALHYQRVAERMLAIAGQRPVSLLRCPDGIGGEHFFQKHAGHGFGAFKHVSITENGGAKGDFLCATKVDALIEAAQMGTVEFHVWGARIDRLDRPDRLVFDLDPDEGLGWKQVRGAALLIRDRLEGAGLASVPVLSGGKGVHVCVILRRDHGWETIKGFAKAFAHMLASERPAQFTATMAKASRKGRIFIDWMRNERGSTAVSPWSLRAREGAPVAVPVTWKELRTIKAANVFRIGEIEARLALDCPYAEAARKPQRLTADTIDRLLAPSG